MAAATAFFLVGERIDSDRLIAIDSTQKSLKKQLRDTQIRIRLDPTDFESRRTLDRIREKLQALK